MRGPDAPGRGLDVMLAIARIPERARGRRTACCLRTFFRPASSVSSLNGDGQYSGRRGWVRYPSAIAEGGELVEVVPCARLDGG